MSMRHAHLTFSSTIWITNFINFSMNATTNNVYTCLEQFFEGGNHKSNMLLRGVVLRRVRPRVEIVNNVIATNYDGKE